MSARAGPAPRAGRERDGAKRARARASTRSRSRCSRSSRSRGRRPRPQRLRRAAADQRQCGAHAAARQLAALRGLPVYAVGEATAEAAREAGFDIAATGDAGVDRLLGSIEPDLKLLHLCGEDRREPEACAGRRSRAWSVYRAKPVDAARSFAAPGQRRADPLARAPAGASPSSSNDRGDDQRSPRSAPAAAEAVGDGWRTRRRSPNSRPTTRCWPSPRGCATSRTRNERRPRNGMGWGARLLIALVLILLGAGAAIWSLAHYPAGRALPRRRSGQRRSRCMTPEKPAAAQSAPQPRTDAAAADERADRRARAARRARSRMRRSEPRASPAAPTRWSSPSPRAGRSIAESRSAILENLLVDRFGAQHQAAVATIITASHQPVRLDDLISRI